MNILLMEVNPFVPISLPISLGYMAAALKADGHRVEIRNVGEAVELSPRSFQSMVKELRPTLVGFAAYQRNILHVLGMARAVKEVDSTIKVILGGPQATFLPSEALTEMPDVDYVCRGEGEPVIQEVVRALDSSEQGKPLPGTSTRLAKDFWEDGPKIEVPEDLDVYPSPFLEGILDLSGLEEAILLTSRGCPYRCSFCYTPRAFGGRIRYHSIDRVLAEMSWLSKKGIERFWLADPSFSFRRDRTEELLQGIIERGIQGRIWLETRADLVDAELVSLMASAGVRQVAFGLESGSERVLEGLGKGIALDRIREGVELVQKHGMEAELFSQYGLPQERFEDAMLTLDFVKSCVPIRGNTNAQQTRLYFGTRLQDQFEEFGIRPLTQDRPAYISIGSRYETDWMDKKEIRRIGDLWKSASLDGGKRLVS